MEHEKVGGAVNPFTFFADACPCMRAEQGLGFSA